MNPGGDGSRRMLDLVHGMAEDLEAGYAAGAALRPARLPEWESLLLCGMGGSAIAGDLIAPLVERAGHRLAVRRDYGLPVWIDRRTTVLLSSYSGDTEEVLSAAAAAADIGCPRFGSSSGGALGRLADGGDSGFPRIDLPGGLPPRAALGHGLGALCGLLELLRALPGAGPEIAAAAAVLRAGRADTGRAGADAAGEDPDALAALIGERHVVIYTTSDEAHPAGQRLKAQLNENAKLPAAVERFPELDHNDIEGWRLPSARRDAHYLLVLRSGDEAPAVTHRVDVTLDLLCGAFAGVSEVRARGDRALARIMSLVQFGDYLSCRLAGRRGVDPWPVDRIEELKRRLGRSEGSD